VTQQLVVDELIDDAKQQAQLDDLGDSTFLTPLSVLVEALEREARLDPARRAQTSAQLVALLVKRLRLVDDRKTYPTIRDETVRAPIFIVGAPRTGSTHLHTLLGQDPQVRVPQFWEQNLPSPPPERETYTSDPRIAQIREVVAQIPAEMLKRHTIGAQRPEQCNLLMDWSFINFALLASYDIPTYRYWLFEADHAPAYEAHWQMLQQLQWHVPGQWVLKYPKHLLALETLLARYPDARLIWTHRDPAVFVPSAASLTGYMRSPSPGYDPQRFGLEWALNEEMILRRGLCTRDRFPDARRDYDVHYRDLMADPVQTIGGIYRHFGLDFTDDFRRQIEKWVQDHPKTEHGMHRYTPADFGLCADRLRQRFAFYSERFGIQPEVGT